MYRGVPPSRRLLKKEGLSTAVGDEGGFAPDLKSDEEALDFLLRAIEAAGYRPGEDFVLAMDAASSEWKGEDGYCLPKSGRTYTADALIEHWKALSSQYPVRSIEDALDEEDWAGWQRLTAQAWRPGAARRGRFDSSPIPNACKRGSKPAAAIRF